jgi:hypothetical protein
MLFILSEFSCKSFAFCKGGILLSSSWVIFLPWEVYDDDDA